MKFVLDLWLNDVPQYTVSFCQLILAYTIVYQSYHGIELSIHACGKIKNYQIWGYGIQILVLPLSYWALAVGFQPESVLLISLASGIINLFVTIYFAYKIANLNVWNYIKSYLIPIYSIITVSLIVSILFSCILPNSFLGLLAVYSINSIFAVILFWFIGMDSSDKLYINGIINKILRKK